MKNHWLGLVIFSFATLIINVLLCQGQQSSQRLVFDQAETAGISGLRPFWDRPVVLAEDGAKAAMDRGNILKGNAAIWARELEWHRGYSHWMDVIDPKYQPKPADPAPGAIAFDAVHRSLLVRFPGCAEGVAEALKKGGRIARAELVLPFRETERLTPGYEEPSSFIGNMWDRLEPRWHAVAWRLRRAWKADPATGPTFNDAVKGRISWTRYGAQDDEHDRFPAQFGPAEVSKEKVESLDVTAAFLDQAYGRTLGERLRGVEECGFIVRKLEYYDMHFETPGYEWAAMTGGRGIIIGRPQLVLTIEPAQGSAEQVDLPPAADPLSRKGEWKPTAVLPDEKAFEALREKYAFRKPAWMPDWQWQRAQELYRLDGQANAFPAERREYVKWIDEILRMPPRAWHGFQAADQLTLVYDFADAFPPPVLDHLRLYWTAWLMPHRDTWDMVHNQYHQIYTPWRELGGDYVDRTGDWRGNKSFYRESYCRFMSTMNFNHTAAVGALLGGHFIGSDKAVADGRYGLEMFPLRLWSWFDGTLQEAIDHYYLSITLTDQKTFADYGPREFDRLMGRSLLWKSMEELSTCYHPMLRRYVSAGGRTTPFYATQVQDGVQHIAHVLCPKGALTDTDKVESRQEEIRRKAVNRPPIIGHDLSPRRVAMQSVKSPWAPEWVSAVFEDKPLPFEVTAAFRQWGAHIKEPKFKRSYMGRLYGLASFDYAASPTLNLQALWNRKETPPETAEDIGQLLVRFGYNRVNFIDTMKGGTLGNMGGSMAVLQHRNVMLILSSPNAGLKGSHFSPDKDEIRSIQTAACLFALREQPGWTISVDGKEISSLPFACKAGSRIAIQDGAVFVGIIPLETTDLGRDVEVMLKEGGEPVMVQSGEWMRESLLIENYFYRSDERFDLGRDPDRLDAACGGFVVVMGDRTEFAGLPAFQKHLDGIRIRRSHDPAANLVELTCEVGGDRLEMGFRPRGADSDDHQIVSEGIPYRRVNGKWPYLPEGVERESNLSILGRRSPLEKNGARLFLEPNQMGYVLTEPKTGVFLGANPLPDLSWFRFETPGGISLEADGRIGLGFFCVQPSAGKIDVEYALHPDLPADGAARCLIIAGMEKQPQVAINGAAPAKPPVRIRGLAPAAWAVPLVPGADPSALDAAAVAAAREEAGKAFAAGPSNVAVMVYERGEHYLLTRPGVGAWSFQRLWPVGSAFRVETPEGIAVTADGRLAFLQLVVDAHRNRIELAAPRYLNEPTSDSQKFDEKAKALVIFGPKAPPEVVVNGKPAGAEPVPAEVGGRQAFVVPLYDAAAGSVLEGLAERYASAQAKLPTSRP